MTTLKILKRKLRSIANIKKITDAMERVAAARLKKAEKRAESARPYMEGMENLLKNVVGNQSRNPLFVERRGSKKIGFIVIASDRGLTGPYNSNIFAKVSQFLKDKEKGELDLYLFGKKAIDYFSRRDYPIRSSIRDWGEKLTFQDVQTFMQERIQEFVLGAIDELFVIYTHYISAMRREVRLERLIPFVEKEAAATSKGRIFEPSNEEILRPILSRFFAARLQQNLHESYASELASRIFAMRSASSNCEELIESLTLKHNKLRQGQITREMIEITAGAIHE